MKQNSQKEIRNKGEMKEFWEGSRLLYVGDDEAVKQAFDVQPKDNEVFVPKVMSRKKQIIPSLSALWG